MAIFERKTEKISYKDNNSPYQTGYYKELNNDVKASLPEDYSTPYSFKEWLDIQDAVEPNSQYEFYLRYIAQWYRNYFTKEQAEDIIKTNYITLLKQLNIVFKNEINEKWFLDLSLDSDLDIQDMIEFYSKKLKQIAYFIANKRESLKSTKLKYNTVGSNFGTAKLFADYILNAFTKKTYGFNTPDTHTYNNIPELSSINPDFQISIEELYDESNYYDRNPSLSATSYFNITAEPLVSNLTSLGLTQQDASWIYSLGANEVVSLFVDPDFAPLSAYGNVQEDVLVNELLVRLTEKYLGATHYNVTVTSTENNYITATYNFAQGNNWFYWPSGEYIFEANPSPIGPLPLSATTLLLPITGITSIAGNLSATTGGSYRESDRIFVIDGEGNIKGAWAQSVSSESVTKYMSAYILGNSEFIFKYPFPGYGEGSDTLPWTGKTYENITGLYRFLDSKTRRYIESSYFSDSSVELNPVTPIKINETTLSESGAKPSKQYKDADKITFRSSVNDQTPNGVFTEDLQFAWLYDVTRTNLGANVGVTNIYWPLQTFVSTPDNSLVIDQEYCSPIALSSLSHEQFKGSRSGSGLYDSDIFYILDGINGEAIQAAWLSGQDLKTALTRVGGGNTRFTAEISGTHQPGLYMKCFPGQYSTFIWGESSTDINDTNITYHTIPPDSEYLTTQHNSIYGTRTKDLQTIYQESKIDNFRVFPDFGLGPGVGDWKTDTSRSVLYSPIGHPGDKYTDFDKMSDIIFVDTSFPEPFSLITWRGTDNKDYTTSKDFAWFKLDKPGLQPEQPDVGWGPGKWVNFNGTGTFVLSAGMQYKYLRANLRRSTADIQFNAVPYMVISEPYPSAQTKWAKASYNGTIFIPDTAANTEVIITPGDIVAYDHYDTTSYCITASSTVRSVSTSFYNKVCSTDYRYWVDYNLLETGQVFVASWPTVQFYSSDTTGPSPVSGARSYDKIVWRVTNNAGLSARIDELFATSPFVMQVTANQTPVQYTISAAGHILSSGGGNNTTYILRDTYVIYVTSIPVITRYRTQGDLIYQTIKNLTIPVDICVPLSGWNIDTKQVDSTSPHAKPFWATATDENDFATLDKGIPISERSYSFEHEIILKQQPPVSPIVIDSNKVIQYQRKSSEPLTWVQPLAYESTEFSYKWKKLLITDTPGPLSAFTCETFTTPNVTQTDQDSDIILVPPDDGGVRLQYINYFAINPFTWLQPIPLRQIGRSSISIDISAQTNPEFEVGNLLNRHYPTVAAVPDLNNLVSESDIGIYTPTNLGLPMYLGKSHSATISANTSNYTNVLDVSLYESDFGFAKELNVSPVIRNKYNATWMKTPATFIAKSGVIQNSKPYEKFNSYQNNFEISNRDTVGLNHVSDVRDPWSGEFDTKWTQTKPSVTDFRGINNIQEWLSTFITPVSSQIYYWGSDLYGNNYALLKPIFNTDPYSQQFLGGELWVRSANGDIFKGTQFLSTVITDLYDANNPSVYNEIINNNIQKFAVIEDILYFATPSGLGITRIEYNYDDNTVFTRGAQYKIKLYADIANTTITTTNSATLGNILHITQNNTVLFPVTLPFAGVTSPTPQCVELLVYDTANNKIYPKFQDNTDILNLTQDLISYNVNECTAPVLTYNDSIKLYNISFLARNKDNFTGDYLISINFTRISDNFVITKIDKLVP